jgi:hypothetical protein
LEHPETIYQKPVFVSKRKANPKGWPVMYNQQPKNYVCRVAITELDTNGAKLASLPVKFSV